MLLNLKYFLSYILLCSLVWALGFCGFVLYTSIPSNLEVKADTIVILTGGKHRIEEGLKIFSKSTAKKILISGVGDGVMKKDFKALLTKYKIKQDEIVLGSLAQNTLENALEAKIFMHINGFQSLILVTSNYHMPRSSLIFGYYMPNIKIYSYPISKHNLDISNYKLVRNFIYVRLIEYNKYCFTVVDILLDKLYKLYYSIIEFIAYLYLSYIANFDKTI